MKAYLNQLMLEQEYSDSDRVFLLAAYEKIQSNTQAWELFSQALAAYEGDYLCDHNEQIIPVAIRAGELVGVHPYTAGLLVYLCMTRHLRTLYIERGLSLSLYHDTVLDLRYKLEECKVVRGIIGSFVTPWFIGFFKLTRFAFGRLQLEVIDFHHEGIFEGRELHADTKVINVHIPRDGTPLDAARCEESFAAAKQFFSEVDGETKPFVCHSWLLYPENEHLLSPKSNVYRFFKRFEIFESGKNEGEDLWRLFDTNERNPDRLPADSSMRRAYVSHLKNGGRVGWGRGIFFY